MEEVTCNLTIAVIMVRLSSHELSICAISGARAHIQEGWMVGLMKCVIEKYNTDFLMVKR